MAQKFIIIFHYVIMLKKIKNIIKNISFLII
jgi:hypothetical protein